MINALAILITIVSVAGLGIIVEECTNIFRYLKLRWALLSLSDSERSEESDEREEEDG